MYANIITCCTPYRDFQSIEGVHYFFWFEFFFHWMREGARHLVCTKSTFCHFGFSVICFSVIVSCVQSLNLCGRWMDEGYLICHTSLRDIVAIELFLISINLTQFCHTKVELDQIYKSMLPVQVQMCVCGACCVVCVVWCVLCAYEWWYDVTLLSLSLIY